MGNRENPFFDTLKFMGVDNSAKNSVGQKSVSHETSSERFDPLAKNQEVFNALQKAEESEITTEAQKRIEEYKREAFQKEKALAELKILKDQLQEAIDLVVRGEWIDEEKLKKYSIEVPEDPSLICIIRDSVTEHVSGGGGQRREWIETQRSLKFVPSKMKEKIEHLLGLDDELKEKLGILMGDESHGGDMQSFGGHVTEFTYSIAESK